MTNTLQSTTHNINTALGISMEFFFPKDLPNQGSGQGNGSGPTI